MLGKALITPIAPGAQGKLVPAGICPQGRDARLGCLELNFRF